MKKKPVYMEAEIYIQPLINKMPNAPRDVANPVKLDVSQGPPQISRFPYLTPFPPLIITGGTGGGPDTRPTNLAPFGPNTLASVSCCTQNMSAIPVIRNSFPVRLSVRERAHVSMYTILIRSCGARYNTLRMCATAQRINPDAGPLVMMTCGYRKSLLLFGLGIVIFTDEDPKEDEKELLGFSCRSRRRRDRDVGVV